MKRPFEAWRRTLWLWGIPLGFCVLNLVVFVVYRTFAGEVADLERRYEAATEQLAAMAEESEQIEVFLSEVEAQQESVGVLYQQHFQTEAQRFTAILREVQKLAGDAGLKPSAFSYPQVPIKQGGLIQRDISFGVEGTYRQLRTFINFLELTEHFVSLNSVSLSESVPDPNNPRLGINLRLTTVFVIDSVLRRAKT